MTLENLIIPIFPDPKHNAGRVKDIRVRPEKALAENRRWSQDQGFVPFTSIWNLTDRR